MGVADIGWGWWVFLGPSFGFVIWTAIDAVIVSPRLATRKFAALAAALGRPVARESAFVSSVAWQVDDHPVTVRTVFVGSEASVRGMRGYLLVLATPLRAPGWAMHDVEIRRRRQAGAWEEQFACVESGVPVRDGWLSDGIREATARLLAHPLAPGRLRTDRGELQYVASWSQVGDTGDAVSVRDLLTRFGAVAEAFDRAASRRHPMV